MNALELRTARIVGLAVLVLLALMTIGASLSSSANAATGVSGQFENWNNIEFGEDPGQLFNAGPFGVDPVDGSTYILSNNVAKTQARINKFTSTGEFKGSVAISRQSGPGGEGLPLNFVGIAVNHTEHLLYVVESEEFENTPVGETFVALKLLAYSTEPTGGQLTPAGSFALPGPTETGAIFLPTELHVDETTGELELSGVNSTGHALLQRLSPTGEEKKFYAESGDTLAKISNQQLGFSFDVAADGTTYIVAREGGGEEEEVGGFSLPPEFEPAAGTLSLSPIPGFAAASIAENWGQGHSPWNFLPETTEGVWGPQVAAVTAPDGEETLYWKVGRGEEEQSKLLIHGYSIQQEATTPAFGGGIEEPECAIESRTTSLASTTDGDLMVFSQGPFTESLAHEPSFGPNVYRFGPGGGECPGAAPQIGLITGGHEVSTVSAGTSVELDASGSEEGDTAETKIESLVWSVEDPSGHVETIPVTGPKPTLDKKPHTFSALGTYTVRLKAKTEGKFNASAGSVGDEFVAKPKKLVVTASTAEPPMITKIEPDHGPATGGTTVKITGEHLAGATAVEFGTAHATVTNDTEAEITVTSPAGTAGTKAPIKVTTPGGTATSTEEFEWQPVPAPVITKIEPDHGPATGGTTVKITGEHLAGASAVEFGTSHSTVTSDTETEIRLTSPAGTPGAKAPIKVTTPGGTATSTEEFEWEVIIKHKLTIAKGGSGSGTVLCDGGTCETEYAVHAAVTLTAVPGSGSTFTGWSGGGCSGTAPCKVEIETSDVVVGATFEPTPSSNNGNTNSGGGTTNSGGGTTNPGGGNVKTPAQKLQERRQKAIVKCKKLSGKAEAKCLKKARQIGKPKKKVMPKKNTAKDLVAVLGRNPF